MFYYVRYLYYKRDVNTMALEERGQNERALIEKETMRIVRLAGQAFNTGDLSKVHEFISPDYVNRVSQGFAEVEGISNLPNDFKDIIKYRSGLKGPEEFIDTVKSLRNAFGDLHYTEQEIIASREKVITLVNVSGKHVGNFFGIPPTGRNFTYEAMHMFRILDNKIVEHRAICNDLSFMMQMNLVRPTSQEYESLFQAWKGYKGR